MPLLFAMKINWLPCHLHSFIANLVVGKLVLRSSAGTHGPKGNYTVLYDGEGELDFGLAKHHIFYRGKGDYI